VLARLRCSMWTVLGKLTLTHRLSRIRIRADTAESVRRRNSQPVRAQMASPLTDQAICPAHCTLPLQGVCSGPVAGSWRQDSLRRRHLAVTGLQQSTTTVLSAAGLHRRGACSSADRMPWQRHRPLRPAYCRTTR